MPGPCRLAGPEAGMTSRRTCGGAADNAGCGAPGRGPPPCACTLCPCCRPSRCRCWRPSPRRPHNRSRPKKPCASTGRPKTASTCRCAGPAFHRDQPASTGRRARHRAVLLGAGEKGGRPADDAGPDRGPHVRSNRGDFRANCATRWQATTWRCAWASLPGERRKAGFCGQLDTRRSRPPRTRPPHEHGRFQRPSKARTRSAVNGQSSSRPSAAANTGTREP